MERKDDQGGRDGGSGGGGDDDPADGAAHALPGDLLYLGEAVDAWDLGAGYYVLAGQVGDAVVLTRAAGDGTVEAAAAAADAGDQVMVPGDVLRRMALRAAGAGASEAARRAE